LDLLNHLYKILDDLTDHIFLEKLFMTQDSWKARLVSTHSQDHAVGSEGPGKFLSMLSLNWKEMAML